VTTTQILLAIGAQTILVIAVMAILFRKSKKTDDSGLMIEAFDHRLQNVLKAQMGQIAESLSTRINDQIEKTKGQFALQSLEIQNTVLPLKSKLDEYQKQFFEIEKVRSKEQGSMFHELQRVTEVTLSLNNETRALKDALKKPHVRGRWGEVQLKNCVEIAGMSEHCDLSFQNSYSNDDQQLRPDMIVRMPNARVVVVDAKTPLDGFIASLESNNDVDRQTHLVRHGRQVKDHVKKLSQKAYHESLPEAADFTILFLPNESFLYAALEVEPDLVEFAIEKKILIASPPTLIGLLKAIRYGWSEKKLADNAQAIALTGQELHKRLSDMVDAFHGIGSYIDKSKAEYEKALMRLNSRVIPQAQRLEDLGAKSTKDLGSQPNNLTV
jgi:DNA recombination protein RmuC